MECEKKKSLYAQHSSNFFPLDSFFPRGFVCKKSRCYLPEVQQTDVSAAHTWTSSPLLHRIELPRGIRCAGRSYTRRGFTHTHEIPLPGVQQPLLVELRGAEDLAKGHQPTGLTLLWSPQALPRASAAPARALQPQHYFIQQSLHQTNLTWETSEI